MNVDFSLLSLVVGAVHLIGIASAIDALYLVRTSRSGIAWGLSLITFPWIALPMYWIFGRSHFRGYRELLARLSKDLAQDVTDYHATIHPFLAQHTPLDVQQKSAFEKISGAPFLGGNRVKLLIDGDVTFHAVFEAARAARSYILIQSYILRADVIGGELRNILVTKAAEGVKVYVLFDEIGSKDLPAEYIGSLRSGGVEIRPFATRQGRGNFFQFNFRNHRKVIIVDGTTAFVGGLNIGDEYLSRAKVLTPWRDTHLMMQGPVSATFQNSFFRDWMWATQSHPSLPWPEVTVAGEVPVLCVAVGPVGAIPRCTLYLLELINDAKERLWIASPYFVPDDSVLDALKLAALRGVDIRILLPGMADSLLSWWAAYTYLSELTQLDIKVYRTKHGFMHQKVILVDDSLASVGTINLDNRSMHLNFEITALVACHTFAREVESMLNRDFEASYRVDGSEFARLKLPQKLLAKFARLFSPIL